MPPEEVEDGQKHVQSAVRWADIETGEPPQQHGEFFVYIASQLIFMSFP